MKPHLDTESEPWVATFPGLGSARVAADGTFTVLPIDGDPDGEAAGALRHGWAETLSWCRRGAVLTYGTAVCLDGRAMLITGDVNDTTVVALGLLGAGWSLLSDRPAPVTASGSQWLAHPRSSPMVASIRRAERMGVPHAAIRGDQSDATAVVSDRELQPTAVRAILGVRRRRQGEPVVRKLLGHERFAVASSVAIGGVLRPNAGFDADSIIAADMRWAALPAARFTVEPASLNSDLSQVLAWWAEEAR